MPLDTVLIILIGVGIFATLLQRTNVAMSILGLCAGFLISEQLSTKVIEFLYKNEYDAGSLPLASIVSLALIFVPTIAIIFRFRHYQSDRMFQHVLPVIGFVLLSFLLVLDNSTTAFSDYLLDNSFVARWITTHEVAITAGAIILAVGDVLVHERERKRKVRKLKRKTKRKHDRDE